MSSMSKITSPNAMIPGDKHYFTPGQLPPKNIPDGRVLCHNHVAHSTKTKQGTGGFRAWTQKNPPPGFVECDCGWSGLPHYARGPRS
jgi:hypothetical protein